MKKSSIFILVSLLIFACSEKFDPSEIPNEVIPSLKQYYLSISNKEFDFPNQEYSLQTSVSSSGFWTFTDIPQWISLTPSQGDGGNSTSVTLRSSQNTLGESRLATFTLQAPKNEDGWHASHLITASQKGASPYITVSPSNHEDEFFGSLNFNGKANSYALDINSNCDFNVTSSADWMTFSLNGDKTKITISVTENNTTSERSCELNLKYQENEINSVYTQVKIYQQPANISASAERIEFEYTGGSAAIVMESEASWSASTASSFIELQTKSQPQGSRDINGVAGKDTIIVNTSKNGSKNSREGSIILTINGSDNIAIPVIQGGVTLYVSEEYLDLQYTSSNIETKTVEIESNGSWKISSNNSWITTEPSSGSGKAKVTITAANNPYLKGRNGTVTISSLETNELEQEIAISQSAKVFELYNPSSDESILTFGRNESEQNIIINTNGNWSASTDNSDWITITNTGGSPQGINQVIIPVKVTANSSTSYRRGNVTITMENETIIVGIYQDPAQFELYENTVNFGMLADSTTIYFNTNSPWSAKTSHKWISVTPESGAPDGGDLKSFAISIAVSENNTNAAREGKVTVSMFDKTYEITVTQAGPYLDVSTSTMYFDHNEESREFSFSTNGIWSATSDKEWIVVTPQSGTPGANNIVTLTIKVLSNNTTDTRKGSVTIAMYEEKRTIEIEQEASNFDLGTTSLTIGHGVEEHLINFSTNTEWTAISEVPWLSISPANGTSGWHYITVKSTHNDENIERKGNIVISTKSEVKVVQVTQAKKYLEISNNGALDFDASGGTCRVSVTRASDKWKVSCNADWISANPTSGEGWSEITLTIGTNNSRNDRQCTVTIENDYNLSYKLNITQKGRTLSVSDSAIEMFAFGGTASATVVSDGDFDAVSKTNWITVEKQDGTNTIEVIVAENEKGAPRTGTITVSLAGQPAGEDVLYKTIEVKQDKYKNSITLKDFEGLDESQNIFSVTGFKIKINLYSKDIDFNNQNGNMNTTVDGYKDDKDNNKNGNGNINIGGYGEEHNWNEKQ